ncbi:zinc-binding alcohol dehydrogenase/oxidoreductase [Salinibacillus kushneri]|uniref:Zinc-binding alcohol dehydrogenase/oxidoreductase n=1 Tax=Salinibacillus kushneri TaxID=237682 RepID=A0A1I0IR02_9BACI|nr:zinc-binding dehydrogenase [Salinibacillus kushneri]SET98902.1 zinc-binding alcohol dehydrogenase/oxidoreductase [Salinibacillus kushneri]
MKAIVHKEREGLKGLFYQEMDEPTKKEGQVIIKLKAAGMNRRDVALLHRHKSDQPPLIMGSDGAGVVEAIGDGVHHVKVGDEVVIDPSLGWQKKSDAPPKGFEILSMPDHGTFAEYIAVPAENVEKKPAHLSWIEAGVLPLAALTGYRALFTRGQVQKGDTVMLPGIGSGVLTYVLMFAKAAGARVIVTSRSEEKRQKAVKLGADVAIPTESDWNEELKNESVDLLIESIGRATFHKSLGIIRKGGTIVTFGATTEDKVDIDIRKFFYGQYNLLGSTMGSHEEFKEMLSFLEEHHIKPIVDSVFQLSDHQEAFTYLRDSKNFGKIAFELE